MARPSPEQLAQMRDLREQGMSYRRIAAIVGVTRETVRHNLNPVARARYNTQQRACRRSERRAARAHNLRKSIDNDRDAARQTIPPDDRDLTARTFGDPVDGRRALDMRGSVTRGVV